MSVQELINQLRPARATKQKKLLPIFSGKASRLMDIHFDAKDLSL